MISNNKDIWRLESKWSDHDRFWKGHDRNLAEVSYDFFSISLAPTNIVVSGHTKNYGKMQKPMRRREVLLCKISSYNHYSLLSKLTVFTVNEYENICIAGLNRQAGYATVSSYIYFRECVREIERS